MNKASAAMSLDGAIGLHEGLGDLGYEQVSLPGLLRVQPPGCKALLFGTTSQPGAVRRLVVLIHGAPVHLRLSDPEELFHRHYKGLVLLLAEACRTIGTPGTEEGVDLLLLGYSVGLSMKPDSIPEAFRTILDNVTRERPAQSITFTGHSLGSLLARHTLALRKQPEWLDRVTGLVLFAGTNRGFVPERISQPGLRFLNLLVRGIQVPIPQFLDLVGQVVGGRLWLDARLGTPWTLDLRLRWLRCFEGNRRRQRTGAEGQAGAIRLATLHILGDRDELVSPDDMEDLYQLSDYYRILRLEHWQHGSFLDGRRLHTLTTVERRALQEAILEVVRCSPDRMPVVEEQRRIGRITLHPWKERQQPEADCSDQINLVFLIHGIRDFAEWQENISHRIRTSCSYDLNHLHIIPVRYGYFNAFQFLFPDQRRRAMRAFVDMYFQTLSRFPDVQQERISMFAHSNGTFALAEALLAYSEIHCQRVVLGGSVLPRSFPWNRILSRGQVREVQNYCASQDWPVGLLCRALCFPWIAQWKPLLGIGTAGVDGFLFRDLDSAPAANHFMAGGHGATLRVREGRHEQIGLLMLPDSESRPLPHTWSDVEQQLLPTGHRIASLALQAGVATLLIWLLPSQWPAPLRLLLLTLVLALLAAVLNWVAVRRRRSGWPDAPAATDTDLRNMPFRWFGHLHGWILSIGLLTTGISLLVTLLNLPVPWNTSALGFLLAMTIIFLLSQL